MKNICTGSGGVISHTKNAKSESMTEKKKANLEKVVEIDKKLEDTLSSRSNTESKSPTKKKQNLGKMVKSLDGVGFEAVVGALPNGKSLSLYSRSPNLKIN